MSGVARRYYERGMQFLATGDVLQAVEQLQAAVWRVMDLNQARALLNLPLEEGMLGGDDDVALEGGFTESSASGPEFSSPQGSVRTNGCGGSSMSVPRRS